MKIVVLAGGTSTERAISIVSGTQICRALRGRGHQAILVDIYCGLEGSDISSAFEGAYDLEAAVSYIHSFDDRISTMQQERTGFFGPMVMELCRAADVVFMALHGQNGEDGKVQACFDLFGIRYTGSGYLGSALAMDKGLTKKLFWESGVPTPKGVLARREQGSRTAEEYGMTLPVVVKPCCGGSSVGVSIARTPEEFEQALAEAFSFEEEVVLEQYIEGREFSVGVVDGQAYPVIEIAPIQGFYDYHNKYQAGSTVETCPAVLDEERTEKMQALAEKAYQVLGLECYARMDFMMDDSGEMYCLEANTLPGMTPTSLLPQEAAALGMDFADLCEKLIQVSGKRQEG